MGLLALLGAATAAVAAPAADPAADPAALAGWIDALAGLDSFDTGLSPTHGGLDFPPVAGQLDWSVALLGQGRPQRRNEALEKLVAAGPDALPLLLEHLDDRRATRLVVEHEGSFGGMWHATEVPAAAEPGPHEAAALALEGLNREQEGMPEPLERHTVSVGDACFVIIGMITNRRYNAVRYQPTACIVINSPTTHGVIAEAVRRIWGRQPEPAALRNWLEEDFARGDPGAATRLLYYFPQDAAPRVLERLQRMVDQHDDGLPRLVRAIAWCDDPALRAAIRAAVLATRDGHLVEAGMPAFATPDDPQRRAELERLLARWQARGTEPLEAILATAMACHPGHAAQHLASVLRAGGHDARLACLGACADVPAPPVAPLRRLLDDRRAGLGRYLVEGEGVHEEPQPADLLEHRVCDNAYVLICRTLGDRQAACLGDRAAMNERIAGLRKRLDRGRDAWPFSAAELADREAGRTARARELRERIARLEADPARPWEADLRALEDRRLTPDQWRPAAARLFDQPAAPEPTLQGVVANRRLPRTRVADTLAPADRDRLRAALEGLATMLLESAPQAWPSEDCASFLALAGQCGPGDAACAGKMLERLAARTNAGGLPRRSGDWEAALLALDTLLDAADPGAAELFAGWCRRATPQALDDRMSTDEFLTVLARHHRLAPVAAAAGRMFSRRDSPWHPGRIDYPLADACGSAGLLGVPAFRTALLAAIDREDVTGELSLRADDPDYCWIEWRSGGSSGQGVANDQPCGAAVGGPPMPVRRCDMLLEGVANAVFAEDDGPEFHIYWPQAQRDEARRAWREWLARPAAETADAHGKES